MCRCDWIGRLRRSGQLPSCMRTSGLLKMRKPLRPALVLRCCTTNLNKDPEFKDCRSYRSSRAEGLPYIRYTHTTSHLLRISSFCASEALPYSLHQCRFCYQGFTQFTCNFCERLNHIQLRSVYGRARCALQNLVIDGPVHLKGLSLCTFLVCDLCEDFRCFFSAYPI